MRTKDLPYEGLKGALAVLLMFLCIFGGSPTVWSGGVDLSIILSEALAVVNDPATQWMVFLCLVLYFIVFMALRFYQTSEGRWRIDNPSIWLSGALLIGTIAYAVCYFKASHSTQALTLLAGAGLGQGVRQLSAGNRNISRARFLCFIAMVLLVFFFFASLWHPKLERVFWYRNHLRCSGPWNNPNTYGLLMGVGLVLSLGMFVHSFAFQTSNCQAWSWRPCVVVWGTRVFVLVAIGSTAIGLLQSFSRAAWLSFFCSAFYLAFHKVRALQWLRRNSLSFSVIICALAIIVFWQFRDTENPVVRRAFSTGNLNDISWRNRVLAWEGALQMMANKPWFGFGWNQPELIYDAYYRTSKVEESQAVQLNDYFMLGATLGLPSLVCFIGYVWLSLRPATKDLSPREKIPNGEVAMTDFALHDSRLRWLKRTFRAGTVLLLVGFWFDGGLFKLETAALFWVLLDLGENTE